MISNMARKLANNEYRNSLSYGKTIVTKYFKLLFMGNIFLLFGFIKFMITYQLMLNSLSVNDE